MTPYGWKLYGCGRIKTADLVSWKSVSLCPGLVILSLVLPLDLISQTFVWTVKTFPQCVYKLLTTHKVARYP